MNVHYWDQSYFSIRRPVLAKNVVATSQPLAAQAGLEMLKRGGNAMDAALATAIALTVVEPTSNGIGGDAFVLFNQEDQLLGLNASGKSPKSWTKEHFAQYDHMPFRGWDTVTIPGAVSAWVECSQKYGVLELTELFEPAIRYANEGFLVAPVTAQAWKVAVAEFQGSPDFISTFTLEGRAPKTGECFKSPYHAKTLQQIAESQGTAFYQGNLAEKMVAHSKAQGGQLQLDDLAEHCAEWVAPISMDLNAFRLYEIPPNGQGLAALIALGLVREFDMENLAPESADAIHIQVEAMKLAFADLHAHVTDFFHMPVSFERFLDPDYLKQRARQIDLKQAGNPKTGIAYQGGTVYLCAGDAKGMMVSFIQSNYAGFGSGVVVPETGISLQNRGACFVLEKDHPNYPDGHKKPLHTIIPGMIYQNGLPQSAFGVMGGHMQAQGHLQMMLRTTCWNQNPQTALDAPRWMIGGESSQAPEISMEAGFAPEVLEDLKQRGHTIVSKPMSSAFGGGQFVWKLKDGYLAASDPRKEGQAVGF